MNHHIYYHKETGKRVQTVVRATAVGSMQEVVCYQELYGQYDYFVIPAKDFLELYTKKFPELVAKEQPVLERRGEIEERRSTEPVKESKEEQADNDLMDFLDAETYREKIEILNRMQSNDKLNERMLNNIAVCLDITLEDGRDGYEFILGELEIRKKYEKERLR